MKYLITILLFVMQGVVGAQATFDNDLFIINANHAPDGSLIQPIFFYQHSSAQGAFRAGYITDNSWNNPDSIGFASFASGGDNTALGSYSMSLGRDNRSGGDHSFSFGSKNRANGNYSVAGGRDNLANLDYSLSFGYKNSITSLAEYGVNFGGKNRNWDQYTFAAGYNNIVWNTYAVALGTHNSVYGFNAAAIGHHLIVSQPNQATFGAFNRNISADFLFVVGTGISDSQRSNGIVVNANGNVGIGNVGDPCETLTIANTLRHNGKVSCSSDSRFKMNIQYLETDWKKIEQVTPIEFEWKDVSKLSRHDTQIGYKAQDIEKTYPQLVSSDSDGYLQVDYPKTNVIILGGLKEIIDRQSAAEEKLEKISLALDHLQSTKN